MSEDLWQPSLSEGSYYETKSYNLDKLFYVAFFGGIIPLVVLGVKNARWLRVKEQMIKLIIGVGVALLLVKLVVYAMAPARTLLGYSGKVLRWGFRGVALLFYLGYRFSLRHQYQQHLVNVGEFEPLLKDALIWIGIGIPIETVILFLAVGL